MQLDFKKTYDNAPKAIDFKTLAPLVARTEQALRNWYNGSEIPGSVHDLLVSLLKDMGVKVYWLKEKK